MANTLFVDGNIPVVNAAWLNDVNNLTYNILGNAGLPPATPADILAAISGASAAGLAAVSTNLADTSDLTKGDALIGVKRTETNAVPRTLHFYIQRSKLQVLNYCDPTSDTPTQVAAALAKAIADAKAGGQCLEFEPGATYNSNAEFNFLGAGGIRGMRFWGNGATLYRSSGAGNVASLDSADAVSRCDDIEFTDFRLRGNAASTYGLYMRGLGRSRIHALRALDVTLAGFKVDWSVCTNFKDLMVSNNVDNFAVIPAAGLIVDQSQVGNYTADCIFENMMMEGVGAISGVGIDLVNGGLNNVFRGGTCEGLVNGFRFRNGAALNSISEMDFEQNTGYDISIEGNGLTVQDINSTSNTAGGNILVTSTAQNTTFRGGFLRWVTLDPASKATRFFGTRVSDSPSVGITGLTAGSAPAAGIFQAYGVTKFNTSGVTTVNYADVYDAVQTWVPVVQQTVGVAVTSTGAEWRQAGRLVQVRANLTATAGGTAGAPIVVNLPAAIAIKASMVFQTIGTFIATIGGVQYAGVVTVQNTTAISFVTSAGTNLLGTNPAATLAAGSTLNFSANYDLG